jgi:hypothetical protein
MHRVTYEFTGGPLDGDRFEERGDPPPDRMILEVLFDGTFLYQSNGPVDSIDTVIGLDYVGKVTPHYDHPQVVVRPY